MKRTITITLMALLLCVCMVFGLTACGGFTQDDIDNAVNEATAPFSNSRALSLRILSPQLKEPSDSSKKKKA